MKDGLYSDDRWWFPPDVLDFSLERTFGEDDHLDLPIAEQQEPSVNPW